jgi:hypothetical protein
LSQGRTVQLEIPDDLERAFSVMKELRTAIDIDDFSRLVRLAQAADGYRLVAREESGKLLAVMGYRILHDLAHGSHIYIDDLVTAASSRSQGQGAELLHYAESEARRLGLTVLRLCARIDNQEARKLYEREGWEFISAAYKKRVASH